MQSRVCVCLGVSINTASSAPSHEGGSTLSTQFCNLLFSLIISQSPFSRDVHGSLLFSPGPLSLSAEEQGSEETHREGSRVRLPRPGDKEQPSPSDVAGQNLDGLGERTGQEEETRCWVTSSSQARQTWLGRTWTSVGRGLARKRRPDGRQRSGQGSGAKSAK